MRTSVVEVIPQNSADFQIEIGTALTTQPSVKLLDIDGNPVSGKVAVAVSWVEPRFGDTEGLNTFITAHKQFHFSGDVSDVSDKYGVATFTDLTVIGALDKVAYILIVVDGITAMWTELYNPLNPQTTIPKIGLMPSIVTT